ncbi:MAG TPA: response regulator [Candidatus Bathyarchaeia archaeon]|jgi:CheY-like chemotaxis protein|nr:response regulator [Candidatus Bathyarchaeia archaeon]
MNEIRVLMVGPNTHRATLLLDRLAQWRCAIFFAENCKSALAMLKTKQFDLVLSQLMLPDGTADQFLEPLESSHADVFCTSTIDDGAAWLRVLIRGKNSWLKPTLFTPQDFVAHLDRNLSQDRLERVQLDQPQGAR